MTTVSTTVRRASTLAAMFLFTLIAGSTTAFADAPVGDDWPVAEGRSTLGNLVVFGGGTLVLLAVIALMGLLMARNNYVPPPPSKELATTPGNTPAQHCSAGSGPSAVVPPRRPPRGEFCGPFLAAS